MPRPIRVVPLNVFLLHEDVGSPELALKDPLKKLESVQINDEVEGRIALESKAERPPGWVRFLRGAVKDELLDRLGSRSASGVLFVPVGGRLMALAFGHGRHFLEPGTFEERFGLRACLNAIPPDRIRTVDRKNFEAVGLHARVQATHETSIREFGLRFEQDILRAVSGVPLDKITFGRRLSGFDSLALAVPVGLAGLPTLLERCLTVSMSDEYKKLEVWDWIDNVIEVRDRARRSELDLALVALLNGDPYDRAWLAAPEVIRWEEVGLFRYSHRRDFGPVEDIHLREYLDGYTAQGQAVTIEHLKHDRMTLRDASDVVEPYRWTAYQCLYAEVPYQGLHYILSDGSWYKIDRDFEQRVSSEIETLRPTSGIKLLRFTEDIHDEKTYNERLVDASSGTLSLLDRKDRRYGGGQSRIELCDALSSDGKFLHVKRYSGSSALSHLFSQGVVSAQLFAADRRFRELFRDHLPQALRDLAGPERPDTSALEVAYVVLSRSKKAGVPLPFFSKVSLRAALQALRGLGYKVSLSAVTASTVP